LTVRNRIENRFLQVMAKLDHFLVMTTWTEPATTTAECQDHLMMAIGAFNAGEALVKISAFKILSHNMRDYRAVKPILLLEKFIIDLLKFNKIAIEEFPQGSFLRLSPPVYFHLAAAFHMAPLLPARGIS